jgi:nucleoside diphosphate kinase
LTVLPDKARLYGDEAWFREAWADVVAVAGGRAFELVHEHAGVLFKPDAIASHAIETALGHLSRSGFTPVSARRVEFDRHSVRALWHYRFNVATVERMALHDLIMSAGPSILVLLRDEESADGPVPASVRLTSIKGPSRPERRTPDHLRTVLGVKDRLLNLLHTADEPADLVRELGIFLQGPVRRDLVAEVLRGGDPHSLHELVRELQARETKRDFELDAALARVATDAATKARANGSRDAGRWSDAARLATSARDGSEDARRGLWEILTELGGAVDRWDLATIGSWTVPQDEPGEREPTLGDASVDDYRLAIAR